MRSPWMLHSLLFNKMSRSASLFVVGSGEGGVGKGGQATVESAGEARAAAMAGAAMMEVEDSLVAAAMVEVEDSVVAARIKRYVSIATSTAVLVWGDSATIVRASASSD